MREGCSRIVEAMGSWWNTIGWASFLGTMFGVYFLMDTAIVVCPIFFLLLIAWWIIDVADQDIPWWMILVGVIMMAIAPFTRGGSSIIVCWVIYQFKGREAV